MVGARRVILAPMGVIEFELERTVAAPIEAVFARLADIDGHNDWMPRKGSILRRTRQTSAGEPGLGTTFLDETAFGPTPGEIVEFEPPRRLVHHWWDRARSGSLKAEGWPGYSLESVADGTTLVRHHAKMHHVRPLSSGDAGLPADRAQGTHRHPRCTRASFAK